MTTNKRVDLVVALHVVTLDMLELGSSPKGWVPPIEGPQPFVDGRVAASDVANVAFEVLDIDRIETDQRDEETDVNFRQLGPEIEWAAGGSEMMLDSIEMFEKVYDSGVVCILRPVSTVS